jgi:nucleotide-binding universal stress UspA family protein
MMIRSILLPIDLSDDKGWQAPLEAALSLARLYTAKLHVVAVLPDFGMAQVGAFFAGDYEKKALAAFGVALNDWLRAHVPPDVEAHPHVLHGSIYDEVLRAADKLAVDLIVIGAHRPKLKDYLLGPNAARVVRHASQSVYVVRG